LNSHSSFNEHASVRTAEWPPPAASLLTSPTHLHHTNDNQGPRAANKLHVVARAAPAESYI
jgi:hypothetical protein